ncbi:cardiolipin synthase [Terrimonas sp. NA20]|uniref:Cardiolipin synthase n=1 Tax=Terrimonas ginsenosidimutans TaxID=2908004 RepID=A0ABS9KX33_9BACT|nr:cardiolipin synthase [Terrimonas ginsenosidimutans]MCG2616886.1 cardiolipin synthase [Terrimonas ginsenosidimutans]
MNWLLIGEIVYVTILAATCIRIIYDTRSTTKTMAYLLFAIFFPIAGIIFYFSFGINYRKRKIYGRKEITDTGVLEELKRATTAYTNDALKHAGTIVQEYKELARLLVKDQQSPFTRHNKVKLLLNGEEKFPEVINAIRSAKDHIHIEYYIVEEGGIAKQLEEVLLQKVAEGVEVRFIYDDFGSRSIRRKTISRLREAGIKTAPFYKVRFLLLANRLNYRNHRKIIVIDGHTAFTGGINISDKYINNKKGQLYWRDTHLRIDGPGVYYLQYLFLNDWNFCSGESLQPASFLFPSPQVHKEEDVLVQIAASGPDSTQPTILFSLLQAVYLAQEEILITTPYFIPGESLLEALSIAALSGLSVKLLVPGVSDIGLVNAAARSYYDELLSAGVEIYQYQKGFIHAKTLVADGKLSVVGTANMDYRSFDLNFEVNALVYDCDFSAKLRDVFYDDLKDAERIDPEVWADRPIYKQMAEKVARLLSPLL